MHWLWHWVLWLLTTASSDPAMIQAERAKGLGCANVAYSILSPEPKRETACVECNGAGKLSRPDGSYVRCKCQCANGQCRK